MKGRIVLFNPAPRSGYQTPRRVELPLGLLSISTQLDKEGYDVNIIDEFADPEWNEKLKRVLEVRPICFGVTCMTGPQILHAIAGVKVLRESWGDVPIVWGGVHASLMPEQTLESRYADIAVVGEGEETFPELVKTIESGTPLSKVLGIAYMDNGRYHFTGDRPFIDIDKSPPLSYHLVDVDHYRRRLFGIDHISFNSSRGCTMGCAFCWDPVMHKRQWRAMSPETILEQLRRIVRDYGIRGFLFSDDNFFLDTLRARTILEGIVESGLDISIGKLQIRADAVCKMDKDFFELLKRAKVARVTIGVESGSKRILELIKKGITPEEVVEANRKLVEYPIVPLYLFMMGLPTETPEDFEKSTKLGALLTKENPRAEATFNIYTPYPGTELYGLVREMGLEEPGSLKEWAGFNFRCVQRGARWISPEMKQLIEGLDLPLMVLKRGHFITPYLNPNPVVKHLLRLYYPLARYRINHMDARFPIETKIVKALGLFGRQE